jgi:AI-2 transport protein TqsA
MPSETEQAKLLKLVTTCLIILALTAVGFILSVMKPVMVPLVLALLLSFVVVPMVDRIQVRFKVPRSAAVTVALLFCGLIVGGVILMVTHSVVSIQTEIPEYQQKLTNLSAETLDTLQGWGLPVDADNIKGELKNLPVSTILVNTLESLAQSFTNLLLILIFMIYLISGRKPYTHTEGVFGEVESQIRSYLVLKVSVSFVTGVLVWALLALIGLDLAAVFGLMAFALNFIPSLGSIIATMLPIPLALVQFETALPVVLVCLLPGGLQFLVGNVFEPRFMGSKLKIHPITLMLSLIFWGVLWGIPGMIMATPIMVVLKIVLERRSDSHALVRLMEGHISTTASKSESEN